MSDREVDAQALTRRGIGEKISPAMIKQHPPHKLTLIRHIINNLFGCFCCFLGTSSSLNRTPPPGGEATAALFSDRGRETHARSDDTFRASLSVFVSWRPNRCFSSASILPILLSSPLSHTHSHAHTCTKKHNCRIERKGIKEITSPLPPLSPCSSSSYPAS